MRTATQPARPAQFDASAQRRRALLGNVHIAKKEIPLIDADYRQILVDVAGVESAADCTEKQLVDVLKHFEARGWKSSQGGKTPKAADHPVAAKARAMWISLHHLGVVRNKAEAALEAFACERLKCTKFQWADQSRCYLLIEALKAMAERDGWSQDLAGIAPAVKVPELKRRLVEAILDKLKATGLAHADWSVRRAAFEFGDIEIRDHRYASAGELDLVAEALGDTLRKHGGGQ